MIWVAIGIVPYGLIIVNSGVNLNWVHTDGSSQRISLSTSNDSCMVKRCTAKAVITGKQMLYFFDFSTRFKYAKIWHCIYTLS